MRLRRIHRLMACLPIAVALLGGSVAAQQGGARTALTSNANPVAEDVRAIDAKPAAHGPLSLQTLVAEALEQNPEIKAMRRGFDMMRARIPQAKALPEPTLSYGYAGNAAFVPPFDIQKGDPASARMLSFMQEVPYPGKLAIKGKMANVEAEAEWWNYEQIRPNVVAEVKDAYNQEKAIAAFEPFVGVNLRP